MGQRGTKEATTLAQQPTNRSHRSFGQIGAQKPPSCGPRTSVTAGRETALDGSAYLAKSPPLPKGQPRRSNARSLSRDGARSKGGAMCWLTATYQRVSCASLPAAPARPTSLLRYSPARRPWFATLVRDSSLCACWYSSWKLLDLVAGLAIDRAVPGTVPPCPDSIAEG